MALSVRASQRVPGPPPRHSTHDALAAPRPVNSRRAGSVKPRQRPTEGTPVVGAPGWFVTRRTAPVPSGDPMQWSHSFRLAAIAVTVGLVPLLFVLSMVRAQWSEAPAGQTVVVPMPPLVISPGPRSAPRPTPAPAATTEEPTRPQDTVVTAMLQTKPDPLLPDEFGLLPLESIEALQRSTAELEIRPDPVGLSAAPLLSTIDGSPSRAQEPRREPLATRSIVDACGGRSGEPALGGQAPSSQRGVNVR